MKYADLELDTVYADHDKRPIVVVSLDKVRKPRSQFGYGTRTIRDQTVGDPSFGVIAVRPLHYTRDYSIDELVEIARKHRDPRPESEGHIDGKFEITVILPRLISSTWEEHLEQQKAHEERRQAAVARHVAEIEARREQIARIRGLLPDGVEVTLDDLRDYAVLSLDDMLKLVEAARR